MERQAGEMMARFHYYYLFFYKAIHFIDVLNYEECDVLENISIIILLLSAF